MLNFCFEEIQHLYLEKLCSRWLGPYTIAEVFSHGALEVYKYYVEGLLQVSYAARLND
jgi:hypothetical protein